MRLILSEEEYKKFEREKLLQIEASLSPWAQKKYDLVMGKAPQGYESQVRYFFLYMYYHRYGFVISLFLYPCLLLWFLKD